MKTKHVWLGALALALGGVGTAVAQDYSSPPPPPPGPAQPNPPQPDENTAPPPPQQTQVPLGSVNLPSGYSPQTVQTAIFAALHHRGWTVVSSGPGSIVAHLLHHHVDATITLQYSPYRVDIYESSSYLVGHHAEDRIMPLTRGDWIRNLEHDIPHYLNRS